MWAPHPGVPTVVPSGGNTPLSSVTGRNDAVKDDPDWAVLRDAGPHLMDIRDF